MKLKVFFFLCIAIAAVLALQHQSGPKPAAVTDAAAPTDVQAPAAEAVAVPAAEPNKWLRTPAPDQGAPAQEKPKTEEKKKEAPVYEAPLSSPILVQ